MHSLTVYADLSLHRSQNMLITESFSLLVSGLNHRVHIATGRKIAFDLDFIRIAGRYHIVQNLIDRFFVGDIAIAVAIDIKLERLEFYNFFVGDIGNVNGGKVRIARERALTGKLWQRDIDGIAASGARVGESGF